MKKILFTTVVALAAAVMVLVGGIDSPTSAASQVATVSIVVKMVDGLTVGQQNRVIARNGGVRKKVIPALRLHVIVVPELDLDRIKEDYEKDQSVESVELNKTRKTQAVSNDSSVGVQWSLEKIGWTSVYGTVTPNGTAKVALLDTGVEATHPDLNAKVVSGFSVFDDSKGLRDSSGHGTNMAGIIAAVTNNKSGIAGIAYKAVKIIPVTVLDATGSGQDSDIIQGVIWAADRGADVIVMAFSNADFSQNLQDAVDYAWSRGSVIVAATGNSSETTPTFPAGDRGVIGVSATDSADLLAPFSNYGKDVFLAAPGTDIYTTALNGSYTYSSGTSVSSAIVAGVAAFMKAVDPTLTNGQIIGRLARSADAIGAPGDPDNLMKYGYGRVNMAKALVEQGTETAEAVGAGAIGSGGTVGPYEAATHAFDAASRFTGNANPLIQSYTVGFGGTLLVVSIVTEGSTARTGGAPTYNGVALTQADTTRTPTQGGAETSTELWYLTTPPNGASYAIHIPNSGGQNLYAIASSYKAQAGYTSALDVAAGAVGFSGGVGNYPSVSVTTTGNGAIIVAAMGNGFVSAPSSFQTALYQNDNGAFSDSAAYYLQSTAGPQTMSWNVNFDDWGIVVAAFKEVPMPVATTVGTATADKASSTSITVSMPYTGDSNGSNSYTVDYKLATANTWTNWVTAAPHAVSPYATTITGLTAGQSYDVRVTYSDADGVTGTNPQTITVVEVLDPWPATPQLSGTTGNLSGSFTISADANRLLVLFVSCYDSGNNTGQTFSATYGGKPLTGAYLQNSNTRQTWIAYLKESDIASRSGDAVAVTVTGTHTNVYAYIASYGGINQASPITDAGGVYIANTNNVIIGGPLNVNANGYGVYGWSGAAGATARSRTSDTEGYTEHSDYAATGIRTGVASKLITATGTTNPSVQWSGNNSASVSFVTLNRSVKTDQTITVTTPAPATGTVNGTFNVAATASSGLAVAITSSGACSGSGTGSATITMAASPGTCTVSYNQAGDGTYYDAPQVQETTSVKADPTLSVTNSPVTFNGSAQAASVSGSVAGTVSDVKYNGSGTVPTDAGTYAIMADFAPTDTTNYNSLNDASAGNFIINKGSQAINVTTHAPPTATANGTFGVVATATSGLGVAITTSGACTGSGTGSATITLAALPGTCTVYFNQGGDGNYNAASQVTETTSVSAGVTYAITSQAGFGGTITPPGATSVPSSGSQSYTMAATQPGYVIQNVLVDGWTIGYMTSYDFTNVAANHKIQVNFTNAPYNTIVASAGANGRINPSGNYRAIRTANSTFTFYPSAGYQVDQVLVNGSPVVLTTVSPATYKFLGVSADQTISVTFKPL